MSRYHCGCLSPPLSSLPKEDWYCQTCDASPRPIVVDIQNAVSFSFFFILGNMYSSQNNMQTIICFLFLFLMEKYQISNINIALKQGMSMGPYGRSRFGRWSDLLNTEKS
jgi:hypothetical protein